MRRKTCSYPLPPQCLGRYVHVWFYDDLLYTEYRDLVPPPRLLRSPPRIASPPCRTNLGACPQHSCGSSSPPSPVPVPSKAMPPSFPFSIRIPQSLRRPYSDSDVADKCWGAFTADGERWTFWWKPASIPPCFHGQRDPSLRRRHMPDKAQPKKIGDSHRKSMTVSLGAVGDGMVSVVGGAAVGHVDVGTADRGWESRADGVVGLLS